MYFVNQLVKTKITDIAGQKKFTNLQEFSKAILPIYILIKQEAKRVLTSASGILFSHIFIILCQLEFPNIT